MDAPTKNELVRTNKILIRLLQTQGWLTDRERKGIVIAQSAVESLSHYSDSEKHPGGTLPVSAGN